MVYDASDINLQAAVAHLLEDGYLIVQGLIGASELTSVIADIEAIFDAERESPFDPGDGPSTTDDQQLTDYYQRSYTSDSAEVDRLARSSEGSGGGAARLTAELAGGSPVGANPSVAP